MPDEIAAAPAAAAPAAPAKPKGPLSVNDLIRGSAERRGAAAATAAPAEGGEDAGAAEADAELDAAEGDDAGAETKAAADEVKPDKETEKRLAHVAKEKAKQLAQVDEERSRLARDRAQLERERLEIKTQADEAKRLKAEADEWAKTPPEERWKADYAKTEAGQKDPKYKAAAELDAKERQNKQALADLSKKYEDLETRIKQQTEVAEAKAWADDYLGRIDKAVPENTLAHRLRASDPKDYRTGIADVVRELAAENEGEWPAEAEVLERFEKKQRAQLKKYGIDPEALLKPKKPQPPRPGGTLDVGSGTTTAVKPAGPRKPPTDKELLAGLQASRKISTDE